MSITLVDVNDPPVAKNDTKTFTATSTTTIGVTSNDFSGPVVGGVTSEPGDTVTVTAATGSSKGILSIAANGKGVVYDPRGCATGDDTFSYEITDGHGATAHASVFVTLARPGTNGLSKKPITDTPALAFITGSTIGQHDADAPVVVRRDLGWGGQGLPGRPEHQRRLVVQEPAQGDQGHLDDPQPRPVDALSLARPDDRQEEPHERLPSSLVSRLARTEDGSASIAYAGAWQTHSTSSASGGTERFTSTAGDSATLTVGSTIRAFAIVGPRSSTRGSFQVYVDGVAVATVSEKVSGSTLYRRVLYTRSLAPGTTAHHLGGRQRQRPGGPRRDPDPRQLAPRPAATGPVARPPAFSNCRRPLV